MAAPPYTPAQILVPAMITVLCAAWIGVARYENRTPTPIPVASESLSISEPDPTADRIVIVNNARTEFTFGPDSGVERICVVEGCRSLAEINAWIRDHESQSRRVD